MPDLSVREKAINNTGTLMLQGWCMSSIMCPICTSALMHMKKTGEMQCPGCELPVRMEADVKSSGMSYTNTSLAAAAATAGPLGTSPLKSPPTHSHHQVKAAAPAPPPIDFDYDYEAEGQYEGDAAQPFQSFEEMKREYDATAKKRGDVSSLLGDRMLGGWAMMGVNCDNDDCGTPLMKKPRSEEMECVSCGALYEERDGTLVTTQPGTAAASKKADRRSNSVSEYAPEKAIESTTTAQESGGGVNYGNNNTFDVNDAPTLSFAKSGRDGDASSKIASKLLLGWAMLDEVCENQDCDCNAPLMRDKAGLKHCVGCGPIHPAGDVSARDAATPPPSLVQRGASDREHLHDTGDLLDDEEDEEVFREYAKKRFAAALAGADSTAIPHPSTTAAADATVSVAKNDSNSNSNSNRTRPANSNLDLGESTRPGGSHVLAVLHAKLHSSADKLRQSSHVRDSTELADLILKLALAAKAVAALDDN